MKSDSRLWWKLRRELILIIFYYICFVREEDRELAEVPLIVEFYFLLQLVNLGYFNKCKLRRFSHF